MTNKTRRGGLGRGLGALIPTAPAASWAPPAQAPPAQAPNTQAPNTEVPSERAGAEPTTEVPSERAGAEPTTEVPSERARAEPTVDTGTIATLGGDAGSRPQARPTPRDRPDAAGWSADPQGPLPIPGVTFIELPVAAIHANPRQPRQAFDEDALAELAHSIREFGVLQPIVVRPDTEGYELVMGERRLRAAVLAGLEAIPSIVRATADDAMLRDALLENIHRTQLNPLEEAAAYQQLLEEFGATHDELAHRIGRSRPQVTNTIRLLNLPLAVQRRVAAGVISAGHARALLSLEDHDQQDILAARVVAEGLSVRATEELVTLTLRGQGATKPRRSQAQRITAPGVTELAERLSDAFDTRVRVELGRRKGKITVEFGSVDDLERLVALIAPQLATRRGEPGHADAS